MRREFNEDEESKRCPCWKLNLFLSLTSPVASFSAKRIVVIRFGDLDTGETITDNEQALAVPDIGDTVAISGREDLLQIMKFYLSNISCQVNLI